MTKGEFENRIDILLKEFVLTQPVPGTTCYEEKLIEVIQGPKIAIDVRLHQIVDQARKEYPTEESVIRKAPKYWAGLEGMSEYRTVLRNNVDAERSQWFLKWLGSQNAEK